MSRDRSSRLDDSATRLHDAAARLHDAAARLADGDWRAILGDLLVGPRTRRQAGLYVAIPLAFAVVSLAGYATGVFAVGGGCVVIFPESVAVLGAIVAFALGYAVRGFCLAALTIHGGALGYRLADFATEYAGWTLTERARDLVRLDAMAFYGVLAVAIAFWPFLLGLAVGEGVRSLRAERTPVLAP